MRLVVSFLPFVAFAVTSQLGFPIFGLAAGLIFTTFSLVCDMRAHSRQLKTLEKATFFLFLILTAYSIAIRAPVDVPMMRVVVDSGLLAIILFGILIGRPFTLDYTREPSGMIPVDDPPLVRAHSAMSVVWALALSVIVTADFAIRLDILSSQHATVAISIALFAAWRFTAWFFKVAGSAIGSN